MLLFTLGEDNDWDGRELPEVGHVPYGNEVVKYRVYSNSSRSWRSITAQRAKMGLPTDFFAVTDEDTLENLWSTYETGRKGTDDFVRRYRDTRLHDLWREDPSLERDEGNCFYFYFVLRRLF
jgi:hypothetical protein